jgi:translation initiation factor 2B subunit (eIF-2B alpha/beta/delta family)
MKKIVLVFAVIIGLASCTSQDSNTPTAAIDGLFNAMKSGDIEGAKKFITKNDVTLFETAEKLVSNVDPEAMKRIKDSMIINVKEKSKTVTYTLKNEQINGNTATVEAEVTDGTHKESQTINLLKEDGAWKVSLMNSQGEMFNSMKGNLGKDGPGNIQEGIEKFKNMHPDSQKALIQQGLKMLDSINKKN